MSRQQVLLITSRSQRRFSFVLSAALCLWMLALASHFHVGDYEDSAHRGELCAFCTSVPNTGAAPAAMAFIAVPQRQAFIAAPEILPTLLSPARSGYYSRGPPLV